MKDTGPCRPAASPDVLLLARAVIDSAWLLELAIATGDRESLPSALRHHREVLVRLLAHL